MRKHFLHTLIVLVGVAFWLAPSVAAQNPELRVLCSNAIRASMEKLIPEAEQMIGRHVSIVYATSTSLKKQIEDGAPFDLTILTPELVDDLAKTGKVTAGTQTMIASVDLAIGVKAGSPKVDISTPEAVKQRLLAAKTMTWTEGGASSGAVMRMLKTLGIDEQVKSKIVMQTVSGRPALSVAEGENELCFAPVSEIQTIPGVEVLGFFPKEFQSPVVMTSGIGAKSTDAVGAMYLVGFLRSAKAGAIMESVGMRPAGK